MPAVPRRTMETGDRKDGCGKKPPEISWEQGRAHPLKGIVLRTVLAGRLGLPVASKEELYTIFAFKTRIGKGGRALLAMCTIMHPYFLLAY